MKLLVLMLLAAAPPAELAARAQQAFAAGEHAKAASSYDQLEQQGFANGLLYLNQGNAHFRAGHLPEAILAYRRAERFLPNDPDLRANLEEARRQVLDAPARTQSWWPANLPWLSRSEQLMWAIALWVLGWGLAIGVLLRSSRSLTLLAMVALLGALSLAGVTLLEEREDQLQPLGVVAVDGVILRQGNGNSYAALEGNGMPVKLNRGVEVRVLLARSNGWLRVLLTDGRTGWAPRDSVLIDQPPAFRQLPFP